MADFLPVTKEEPGGGDRLMDGVVKVDESKADQAGNQRKFDQFVSLELGLLVWSSGQLRSRVFQILCNG